jgi:hypothetical protein
MELKLTLPELLPHLNSFYSFFEDCEDITQYYLKKKLERISEGNYESVDNKVYNSSTICPIDLNFELVKVSGGEFNSIVSQIATFPIESQLGRRMVWGLKETTTNTYVGFVRIASPVSSIKPRNDHFGQPIPLQKVNDHFYNGQTIVPVQPFGFNYLGGKLMALVCLSNEVREEFNKQYGTNILVFETTSLYGDSKSSSMYDGLEPYLKYKGHTESENYLFPTDDVYYPLRDLCRQHYGIESENGMVVKRKGSSPKMREYQQVLRIVKEHLKVQDPELYKKFNEFLKLTKSKQRKRFYMSNFGYENVTQHILNGDPLVRRNPEKYDLNNLIDYWKKKSTKRWEKLKEEGRLRTDLETYTVQSLTEGIQFETIR